ncbi:MAG: DNA polymerase III subunit gamma/tau [Flavobacteriaceae bacterium]|nr:DNA polymerase III subunit gamma/tau [Flavobacteriaceae bacterium]MDG2315124.1 DNA polymerase III subunit gamma/tau [Flavobacteriaceae bacterium]
MEHFVVSALKYRPQTFEDVVGQGSITQTLQNAIDQNHLAQALLFCGPRGVGKTTCARILAKKINQDESQDPNEDFAFNIFELDAASNNSVEDIRNVIDQVRIPPQTGQYKVYIIDEVHMLSQAAFNAFLKTLEEPPKHAIFILATTEKHKIIPTILSRCQIYDFKRIGIEDAKQYLKHIADKESVQIEDDALYLIAQKADGAMRDALSIFDRIVSFSGNAISVQQVAENLNVLDYDTYFSATDFLLQQDIPQALLLFDEILKKGFDGHHFITGLASHFRDLWVAKNPATESLLEVGTNTREKYLLQAQKTSEAFLQRGIELANQCDLNYKTSKNQRLLVELCLMQLASILSEDEKKKSKPFIIPAKKVKLPKKAVESTVTEAQVVEVAPAPTPEPVKEIPLPKVQIPIPTDRKVVSGLSLSSVQKKKAHQEQLDQITPKETEQPKSVFSEAQFMEVWKKYTQQLIDQGERNLATLMELDTPSLVNETEIHLSFPNHTNKLELERAQQLFMPFIKNELNNHAIALHIEVNETQEKKYVFTPMEKYEQFKAINPVIEKIRKEFKLDL